MDANVRDASIIGLAVALVACGGPAPPHDAPFGEWRVVSHTAGFVSALPEAEVASWVGREAAYGPIRAVFHDAVCEEPSYTPGTWTPGAFSAHFQIRPSELGIDSETITTMEVGCPGAWTAPGATLILDGDRVYTHWDGVFFELQRVNGRP